MADIVLYFFITNICTQYLQQEQKYFSVYQIFIITKYLQRNNKNDFTAFRHFLERKNQLVMGNVINIKYN